MKPQQPLVLHSVVLDAGQGMPRAAQPDPWAPITPPGVLVSSTDFRLLPHMQARGEK